MADVFRRRFARLLMDHGSEEAPRRIEPLRQVLAFTRAGVPSRRTSP